jgi:hypothetical protein
MTADPLEVPGIETVDRDLLAEVARTVEQLMTVAAAAMVLWQILPEAFKDRVRGQVGLLVADVARMRNAHRDRLRLRSEAWHVGQIVQEYSREGDRARFVRALCVPDPGRRPPGLGPPEAE